MWREHKKLSYLNATQGLIGVIQELSFVRDMEAIVKIVSRAGRQLSGADGASFVIRDGDFCFYAGEDSKEPLFKGKKFPLNASIAGWVILNQEPAVIGDILYDLRIPHESYEPTFVKSLVMVPIRIADPIGAIGIYWDQITFPSPEVVKILQSLADSTSIAIANVHLYEKLEQKVSEQTTELTATYAALSRSEEQYRFLVENANSIILCADQEGKVTFLNQFGLEFFGYREEEILGQKMGTFLPRFDYSGRNLAEMIEDLVRDPAKYMNNENENIRKNGEMVWISWTNRAIHDDSGALTTILSVGNDLTERKKMEMALEETKRN